MGQSLNMDTTLAEATSYIQEVSQSKQITYTEFVKLMEMKDAAGWTIEEQDLRAAFKVFDADNDGQISRDEVREVMRKFGEILDDDSLQSMIAEVDSDNDGI